MPSGARDQSRPVKQTRSTGARVPEGTRPAPRPGAEPANLAQLQRMFGNRAVADLLAGTVQRVTVDASTMETLYNTERSGTGQAQARQFSVSGTYELTRQDDTGVTVEVRIRFMSQSRNTVPPVPPATTPRLGQMIGDVTEIPDGDPRRAWAEDMAGRAVNHWNGRLNFVGTERPAPVEGQEVEGPPRQKRLPVTFRAVPVFEAGEAANSQVIVHPAASVGGSQGHPIDAGNWYEQRDENVYPANDDIIYAHEYGHLLGIPDEYSQSNRQMHLLMHQASPTTAASAGAALDRVTVERMVLAALSRPLFQRLRASRAGIVAALRAKQAGVTAKMVTATREGIRDPGFQAELHQSLLNASQERLHRQVPEIAAFQTSRNFSPRVRATQAVTAEFSGPALTNRILDTYSTALDSIHSQNAAVQGLGDVSVNMSSGVWSMGQGTGPAAAPAGELATSVVGPAAARPGLPAVAPSESLVGQLTALPATWDEAGSALETGITAEQFSSRMTGTLRAANIASMIASVLHTATQPKAAQVGALYRQAYRIVNNASIDVTRQMAAELLNTTLNPILTTSVANLQTQVRTEVDRVMTTPAGAVAATGTPDPNMVAAVAAMRARLDAAKAATAASTSRDPIGAGEAAPDQDVTYSYQGLMGSNATTALRADQFTPMLGQFNTNLKGPRESNFTAESS